MDNATVEHDETRSRYVLRQGGNTVAHADYTLQDGIITFTHTKVEPALEGQGVGSKLAAFALQDARKRGLRVVAACSFIAGYIDQHPEYASLLQAGTGR